MPPMFRCAALALLLSAMVAPARAEARDLLVFAAASLGGALDEAVAGWRGGRVAVSYAASPALARQIAQGAPADVFISADVGWMDYLEAEGLVRAGTRRDLLGNRLVLVAHGAGAPSEAEIGPQLPLADLLGQGRLALADVATVPAGRYAKAALETLGLWSGVADRLAQSENVRAALAFVARGEAPYGVVYATDALAEAGVRQAGVFPARAHPPIVYPAAVLAGGANPEAVALLDYLAGPEAQAVFARHGFTAPAVAPASPPTAGVAASEPPRG